MDSNEPEICAKCKDRKVERKEAIIELVQTEINYGNDLQILKEVRDQLVYNLLYIGQGRKGPKAAQQRSSMPSTCLKKIRFSRPLNDEALMGLMGP